MHIAPLSLLDAPLARLSGARLAGRADLREMDWLVGPKGRFLRLGRAHGRDLRLHWPVNVLVQSPPGTGKTTRIAVPSLVDTPRSGFVVHDWSGHLWSICSGWSATNGHAYRLDWTASDPAGARRASFNFLDPGLAGDTPAARLAHAERVARALVADPGSDAFFVSRARAVLALLVVVFPERCPQCEPSLPALARWATSAVLPEQAARAPGSVRAGVERITSFARALPPEISAQPCAQTAGALGGLARREVAPVLDAVLAALAPFACGPLAERTARSDFTALDLAGRPRRSPDAWAPVHVYLSGSRDALPRALNALFVDVCSRALMDLAPGARVAGGASAGPLPTCFLLDDLHEMGHCESLVEGLDRGRASGRLYVVGVAHLRQLDAVYGAYERREIMSRTGVRVVLSQNDRDTIEEIAALVGEAQPAWAERWLFRPLASRRLLPVSYLAGGMGHQRHLLLVDGYLHRPILCQSRGYYTSRVLFARTWNPRGPREQRGLAPADEVLA